MGGGTATASQHGVSLTDRRTELASATELSALKPGPRVIVLAGDRDVYDEKFSVSPISSGRLIMDSPCGTLMDVLVDPGKHTYPRDAEQVDQFELLSVMVNSPLGCVRDKRPPL